MVNSRVNAMLLCLFSGCMKGCGSVYICMHAHANTEITQIINLKILLRHYVYFSMWMPLYADISELNCHVIVVSALKHHPVFMPATSRVQILLC